MTNFQRVRAWLKNCGKEPSPANVSVQIGCDIEEAVELLRCIRTDKEGYAKLLERCIGDLEWFAVKLKTGESMAYIPPHLREEALDALCDRDVTGNGIAYLMGFDKDAADQEVLRSNDSKFNEDGTPVILPGGKVGKSDRYTPPDLRGFV